MSAPLTGPAPRPLLPVLGRMALGLLLLGAGSLTAWQGVALTPTPGLGSVTTPVSLALDGPRPLDMATSAVLRFEGDRADVAVTSLGPGRPEVLLGQATHRARNPLQVQVRRQGHHLDARLTLRVQPIGQEGVVVTGPQPLQHLLNVALTPRIPLTLTTRTAGGNQTLDLTTTRVRALSARTLSGDVRLTLPARVAGPVALVTSSGNLTVTAPPGARPDALRANTVSGDLALDLRGAWLTALGVGSGSGAVRLSLPARVERASVTTASGDIAVTAAPGTTGNLDVRTQSGHVRLRVPSALPVRVRFTDRETLLRPPGRAEAAAAGLDVFVDAPSPNFTLEETP
ncbi:DUF4097 family beta strand repeat-containing protein [Deinococcus navajonensis]|uniref:DUF4097 domain-containing protein n=1 Tax=Deinococcus navajonensis TaxID=309884 RepID=A0ABV8XPZ6_9DEIO